MKLPAIYSLAIITLSFIFFHSLIQSLHPSITLSFIPHFLEFCIHLLFVITLVTASISLPLWLFKLANKDAYFHFIMWLMRLGNRVLKKEKKIRSFSESEIRIDHNINYQIDDSGHHCWTLYTPAGNYNCYLEKQLSSWFPSRYQEALIKQTTHPKYTESELMDVLRNHMA